MDNMFLYLSYITILALYIYDKYIAIYIYMYIYMYNCVYVYAS